MNKALLTSVCEMKEDDPILVIHWNYNAFNYPNGSRDEDPLHTINALIELIKSMGGQDLYDKHTMFMFPTETGFSECLHNLPEWSRRIPGVEDVATALKITHNDDLNEVTRFDFAFNWPPS